MEVAYLPTRFTKTLLAGAWREDYAVAYGGDTKEELRDREREVIEAYSTEKRIWNKILQTLVFRKRLYLYPHDDFVIDQLRDHGAVEWAQPLHEFDCTSQEFIQAGLVPLTVEYLNAQDHSYGKVTAADIRAFLRLDFIQEFKQFREENRQLSILELLSQGDLEREFNKRFDHSLQERKEFETHMLDLYNALRDVWEWHVHSSELDAAVMWDVSPPTNKEETSLNVDEEEVYTIANIYFEDLKTIEVHSLEDALELRTSPHIQDFRNQVTDAIIGIQNNDLTVAEVESRVESANRALSQIDRAQKTGILCTISPILAPPEPFSTFLTPLGLGSLLYSKIKQEQYSWAFMSRHN